MTGPDQGMSNGNWLSALERLRSRREAGVLVTLATVRGHSPRAAGAKMVVSAEGTWGSVGGGNLAPSPGTYLLGALAGCAAVFLRDTLGPQFGLRIDDVRATASATTDARGLLGMAGAMPDMGDLTIEIEVVSPEPEERLQELYTAWTERCPILLALVKPNAVDVRFKTERS